MNVLEMVRDNGKVKQLLWFAVSILIIGGLVYFADISRIIAALRTADLLILVPALIVGVSNFGFGAYLWHSFLSSMDKGISYFKALKMFFAGHFLNSITPLGQVGGEPLMAYVISRNTDAEAEEAFSAVFSADILNVIPPYTFMIGGAAYLFLFGSFNEIIIQTLYIVALVVSFGAVFVYLLWFKAGSIEGGIVRLLRYLSSRLDRGEGLVERAEERLEKVEENFQKIGDNPRKLFKLTVLMHLSFLTEVVTMFLILLSLGVEPDFAPLYFVMPLAAVAEISPTPGGTGTYEAAMAGVLTVFFPVSFTVAVMAALIYQLSGFWPGNAIGYYCLHQLENGK
jgi:uncharacterized protein (TIRG00374 family)